MMTQNQLNHRPPEKNYGSNTLGIPIYFVLELQEQLLIMLW